MKRLICLMVVMVFAVNASAATWVGTYQDSTDYSYTWGADPGSYVSPEWGSKTTAGDGISWFDVDNWASDATWSPSPALEQGAVPTSSDMAMIYGTTYGASGNWGYGPAMVDGLFNPGVGLSHPWGAPGPVVIDAPGAVASTVFVGVSNYGYQALNITSAGTLSATDLNLGTGAEACAVNNDGTINVSGTLKFDGGSSLGNASTFNMNAGTVDIGGAIDMSGGSFGVAHLDGGTVTAAGLLFDDYYQDNIDITEGVLILDGDWVNGELVWNDATGQPLLGTSWGIPWWTASVPFDVDTPNEVWRSLITAYGGTGTVMYDYDITNPGQTTIWASPVPEPATMMLLGLGSVALLRRRK